MSTGRPTLDGIRQASSGAFDKAKLMVGLNKNSGGDIEEDSQQSERSSFVEEAADFICPELTFQQRLIGFAVCFTVGCKSRIFILDWSQGSHPLESSSLTSSSSFYTSKDLITFMSFKFFIRLMEGNPVPFALNYSFGNLLALGASMFLCGPKRQVKNMFDETRRLTATIYLGCLGGTLVIVFIPIIWGIKLTVLLCLIITQCAASFWYSLSYVPYGRKTALRMIKRYVGLNEQPIEGNVV
jgi:hypothetical protein